MKKIGLFAIALMMMLGLLAGCTAKEEDTFTVGMELAYPPFETKDDKGEPTGVSVDFAKAMGEYLGKKVVIENIAWDGLIPALQTGRVDAVISSMTIKEERKEKIDFSKPYAKALLAILANSGSGITKMEDLNVAGKKVAAELRSTSNIYAEKNLKNATVIPLADESACVTEVVQGKADAFIYDQLTIYRNNKSNPDTTNAVFIPFQDVEYWGVGIKKDNKELLDKVNMFIDDFYKKDGFSPLTEKYLKDEKANFDQFGFEWFFTDVQ